jgi:hypothetical protein
MKLNETKYELLTANIESRIINYTLRIKYFAQKNNHLVTCAPIEVRIINYIRRIYLDH